MNMQKLLENKVAIVTGGTRGIGLAVVRSYLLHGARVVLFGSRQETVDKAVAALLAENGDYPVSGLAPDLSDYAAVEAAVAQVAQQWGRVDILVNNAGISARESIYDYKPQDFDRIMDLNVKAVFYCTKAAAPHMKAQGGGCVINTSSMVSLYGQPAGCGYPASKFAINGLTKSLARELGLHIVAGSVASRRADGFYNTAYVFDRSGRLAAEYDKTHGFTPSGERGAFRGGSRLCRFTLEGKRCGLIICYDIRFPELTRAMALEGLDLLFVPAQWPAKRTMHLETLARARAIENQMFLALCNSAASDTLCGGHSAIIDPWGEYLARAGEGETVITADADFTVIQSIRESINVFRDRRPELYEIR